MFNDLSEERNLIPIHVTQSSYPQKPNTKQWVLAHSELAAPFVELSPVQLKVALIDDKKIARFGCTVIDETTNEKKWIAQKLFVLDFDTKGNDNFWRLSEIKDRLASFHINPMMIYTTFSHTKDAPRYRIVFNLECTIVDKGLAQFLQNALYELFCISSKVEPDSHSKVLVQNWIGGNECVWFNENATVSPIQIMDAFHLHLRLSSDRGTRLFNNCFSSCTQGRLMGFEEIDIEINDMHCVDIGEIIGENQYKRMDTMVFGSICAKWCKPIYIYRETPNGAISTKSFYSPDLISRYDIHSPLDTKTHHSNIVSKVAKVRIDGSKMEQLTERCELIWTFNEGITELPHASLMHLAYNLYSMTQGSTWYKTMLQNYIFQNPKEKMKVSILHSSTLSKAKPSQCQNDRCPFYDTCERRGKNILSQLDTDAVQEIAPPAPGKPVEVIREALRKDIESALAEESTKVHVFKAPCGTGKSEICLDQPLQKTFFAAPEHKLNAELYQRWVAKGKTAYHWQGRPVLPAPYESQAKAIEHLRLTGELKQLLETILDDVDMPDDTKTGIQEYKQSLDDVWKESLVFGTHAKALRMTSTAIDTYIFDEDIKNLAQFTEISQSDITCILSIIANQEEFKDIFSFLAQVETVSSIEPSRIEHNIDAKQWCNLIRKHSKILDSPILSIIDGKGFMRNKNGSIIVSTANPLHPEKKYIILSATANETLYRLIFGDRLVWHEYPDVVKQGKVIQHWKKSYSRQYIKRKGLNRIAFDMQQDMEKFGFEGIITYKYLTETRDGKKYIIGTDLPVLATFGALEGLDAFKGMNIAIYGKPRKPPQYVTLLLFMVTGEFQSDWIKVSKKKITTNQHRFTYYGSNDERYLEMDMGFIVADLEQAIGRSRIIDNPCTVHLFSGMPIQGVEGFDD